MRGRRCLRAKMAKRYRLPNYGKKKVKTVKLNCMCACRGFSLFVLKIFKKRKISPFASRNKLSVALAWLKEK